MFVYDGATPLLESNELSGQIGAGVVVESGEATLSRNAIHSSSDAGVIFAGGGGVVDDNNLYNNRTYGIAVLAGSQPTLSRNWIHGPRQVSSSCKRRGGRRESGVGS